jgi:hypothetical protein
MTTVRISDKSQMEKLVVEDREALNVFDRGYVDYKKFDAYCAAGIRFVTRLKGNAVTTTCKVLAVDPKGPILREATVFLGRNGVNKMAHPLRLIQTVDSQGSLVDRHQRPDKKRLGDRGDLPPTLADRTFLQVAQTAPLG